MVIVTTDNMSYAVAACLLRLTTQQQAVQMSSHDQTVITSPPPAHRTIGIRDIQLVTEPLASSPGSAPGQGPGTQGQPEAGRSSARQQGGTQQAEPLVGETFFFRVNGLDIFAKGANLIPMDITPTRAGVPQIKRLLQVRTMSGSGPACTCCLQWRCWEAHVSRASWVRGSKLTAAATC